MVEAHAYCPMCGGLLQPAGRAQVCASCGQTHHRDPKVGVGVVARDDSGRLLLVQRRIEPGSGLWSLPAGYVDAGENPRAAAARECLEETGLVVAVGAVREVYASAGGGASFFLAFDARVTGGVLTAGDDASDARFFPDDQLPPLAFESTHAAVQGQ